MSAVVNPTVQAMMPLARMLVKQFQDMYSTMSGPKKGMKPVNAFMAFRGMSKKTEPSCFRNTDRKHSLL